MGNSLRQVLEMSRKLIDSVQYHHNSNSNNTTTTHIRFPISNGVSRANSPTNNNKHISNRNTLGSPILLGGIGGGVAGYFDEMEDSMSLHNVFDPDKYSFYRRPLTSNNNNNNHNNTTTTVFTSTAAGNSHTIYEDNSAATGAAAPAVAVVDRCSSPNSVSAAATLYAAIPVHWPTQRTLLHRMESIIKGDLYVLDYTWVPKHRNTELTARHYISRYLTNIIINSNYHRNIALYTSIIYTLHTSVII